MNLEDQLKQWENHVCDRCGAPCDFDGLWRLMGAEAPQHKCKDLHAQAGHLGTAVSQDYARVVRERDNALELVRLTKELRKSPGSFILVIVPEIHKRIEDVAEAERVVHTIIYAKDWVLAFLEEVERLDGEKL